MKYIYKEIEDENTGADVSYHEITAVNIDYKNRCASVTLESYVSLKAKRNGRKAVGGSVTLSYFDEIPSQDENPIEFFYKKLIAQKPEDYIEDENAKQRYGYIDPYLFEDGEIKEFKEN